MDLTTAGLTDAIFFLCAALAVGGALTVALSRNIVRSAFALLATLFGVAAMYACAGADFLAATQLFIYVGGILVLLIFAVMLTHRISDIRISNDAAPGPLALFIAVCVLCSLVVTAVVFPWRVWRPDAPAMATAVLAILPPVTDEAEVPAATAYTPAQLVAARPALEKRLGEWTALPGVWTDRVVRLAAATGPSDVDGLRRRLEIEFEHPPQAPQIGSLLLQRYLLPFEVVSVLLLGALVGAAYLARKEVRG